MSTEADNSPFIGPILYQTEFITLLYITGHDCRSGYVAPANNMIGTFMLKQPISDLSLNLY